ncbi:MAG: DUF1285 domain-containing protein [Spongiibacteraceae bacterium]
MDGLKLIEQHMQGQRGKPPLHLWQPELSGDIDIVIKANGDWFHEGEKIQRFRLVKLFASILRKEADNCYYLVTPVEKWRLTVEDCAFVIVDLDILNAGDESQQIIVTSNIDDKFLLGELHPLSVIIDTETEEPDPVVALDNGLSAKLSRSVFYRLADSAVARGDHFSVLSDGCWFQLD